MTSVPSLSPLAGLTSCSLMSSGMRSAEAPSVYVGPSELQQAAPHFTCGVAQRVQDSEQARPVGLSTRTAYALKHRDHVAGLPAETLPDPAWRPGQGRAGSLPLDRARF